MKFIVVKNYREISKIAGDIIIKEIQKNPKLVVGFATGKTPLGLYKELVKAYKKKQVDFSNIKTFNLDEYYPISKEDRKSYFYYMHRNLFDKVNVKKENINFLNGEAKDFKKECLNYEKKINKNKVDIQILGVGVNGHIGFNEPGSSEKSKTRFIELTESTKKINKTDKNALTMGVSTIMKAKKIILLASGKNKAKALECLMKCKPNKCCPVTFLKNHKNLIVIVDKRVGNFED